MTAQKPSALIAAFDVCPTLRWVKCVPILRKIGKRHAPIRLDHLDQLSLHITGLGPLVLQACQDASKTKCDDI